MSKSIRALIIEDSENDALLLIRRLERSALIRSGSGWRRSRVCARRSPFPFRANPGHQAPRIGLRESQDENTNVDMVLNIPANGLVKELYLHTDANAQPSPPPPTVSPPLTIVIINKTP